MLIEASDITVQSNIVVVYIGFYMGSVQYHITAQRIVDGVTDSSIGFCMLLLRRRLDC